MEWAQNYLPDLVSEAFHTTYKAQSENGALCEHISLFGGPATTITDCLYSVHDTSTCTQCKELWQLHNRSPMHRVSKTVEIFLLWLKRSKDDHQLPWIFEFLLAWMMIGLLSGWYLFEYLCLQFNRSAWSRLVRSGNATPPSDFLPLTPVPRTRNHQSLTWEEQLAELTSLLPSSTPPRAVNGDSGLRMLELLNSHLKARQLASSIRSRIALRGDQALSPEQQEIITCLESVWSQALEIPFSDTDQTPPCVISLIIPAYKEGVESVKALLEHTQKNCSVPSRIQIIVVDAGGNLSGHPPNTSLSKLLNESLAKACGKWGDLSVVSYSGKGGRGGCMNRGAEYALGSILTFLHSDTLLPPNWDAQIIGGLETKGGDDKLIRPTLCAFKLGYEMGTADATSIPGIWGAHKVLAHIRCSLCKLPYGDSTLSFPSAVWKHTGGFPKEQPLMEDYDLVQLLRARANMLCSSNRKEEITILSDEVRSSVRRWQSKGVPYVLLCNFLCLYRYNRENATTEDLFQFYYSQSQNKKQE